jgi:Lipid A 3-O-deacylase (PagL)/Pyridine nucleotide-disulphide oxidoreductase
MSAMLTDARPDKATAVVETRRPERKRVVIVGGGFAGLAAAHALRHAEAEVVLIDRRNHHIFQPLLYQVATAVLSPAEIAAPIRQLEAKQRNAIVLMAEVTGVIYQAYLGAAWSVPLIYSLFIEATVGGAYHDGPLSSHGPEYRSSYGCRLNFHESGSLGLELDQTWRIMATVEHMSNGGLCEPNAGLTSYGVRLGYKLNP